MSYDWHEDPLDYDDNPYDPEEEAEEEDGLNYPEPRERDDDLIDGVGFADPGGRSSLRAATRTNPRNLPCPTCRQPNRLTPADRAAGYQCNTCADRAEQPW